MLLSNSMLILYFEEWYNFPDDRRNYNPFTKQNLKSIRKVHKILKQRKAKDSKRWVKIRLLSENMMVQFVISHV